MPTSVFRNLLGPELDQINGALREFSDQPQSAHGTLEVTHHPGRMARFFIWILKLPKAGAGQDTTIQVATAENLERWNRRIGQSRFRTRHRAVDGLLEERAGYFRFMHRVTVVDGGINYHQVRVYFLGIRLPRLFSPIIDANAAGDESGWILDLTVSCPRCGPICHYTGRVTVP
jgi:Domain of unknown function (DUF4166)